MEAAPQIRKRNDPARSSRTMEGGLRRIEDGVSGACPVDAFSLARDLIASRQNIQAKRLAEPGPGAAQQAGSVDSRCSSGRHR